MLPEYKHGKQTIPISFDIFEVAMSKGTFKRREHRSFLAFLYWFGVRKSEALERVKEDFELNNGVLIVNAPAKKRGKRARLQIDIDMPYVNEIVEQMQKTKKGRRVWRFSERTAITVVKRALGEKYYPHFLRLNRAVHFLDDPTTTMPEMQAWFGWRNIKSIDSYMGFSERHIKKQRSRLRREIEG